MTHTIKLTVIFTALCILGILLGLSGSNDLQYKVDQYEKYQQELRNNL